MNMYTPKPSLVLHKDDTTKQIIKKAKMVSDQNHMDWTNIWTELTSGLSYLEILKKYFEVSYENEPMKQRTTLV